MRFKTDGMAGVCVTVLAIMGMILCGYVLSVQESERVVTGYDYVTDVSGLFDYSQDPQYIPYNPSANWTGFYTSGPDVTGGIDFEESGAANSYPIKQPSTQLSSESVTMAWDSWDHAHPPGDGLNETTTPVNYWISDTKTTEGEGNTSYINFPTVVMLSSIIEGLDLDDGWTSLTIEYTEGSVIIAPQSQWTSREIQSNPGGVIPTYITAWFLPYSPYGSITTLEIDRESGLARAFSGSEFVDTYQLSTLTVSFNSGGVYASNSEGLTNLSNSMTVTAYKAPDPIYMDTNQGVTLADATVQWSNGYPVGGMDVLFRVPTTGQAYTNTMTIPLTDGPGGSSVGTLNVYITASTGGRIQVSLDDGDGQQSIDIGQWRNFILSLDFIGGFYSVVPVTQFATFNDYTALDESRHFDRIDIRGTAGTVTWGYEDASLALGVVATDVFMNTYGVVMTDPSLSISEYFPEIADIRLNFYSFALYGSSVTINGQTFPISDGAQINVPYEDDGDMVDSWHTLTNIYITFEDRTYITFVNDGYTADLGPTTTDTISFTGNWYFTTGLYEGYETTESYYEWTLDKFIFDSNGSIVVYLGLLALGTAIIAKVAGLRALDIVVIVCAGIFGYVMLGAFR